MRHSINVSPFKDRRWVKGLGVLILALNFSGNVYNNNNTEIQTQNVRTA